MRMGENLDRGALRQPNPFLYSLAALRFAHCRKRVAIRIIRNVAMTTDKGRVVWGFKVWKGGIEEKKEREKEVRIWARNYRRSSNVVVTIVINPTRFRACFASRRG